MFEIGAALSSDIIDHVSEAGAGAPLASGKNAASVDGKFELQLNQVRRSKVFVSLNAEQGGKSDPDHL
ncbi:MAG TPA: hypothetical protein VF480_03830 [Verrucomicrobiae bacterium]